MTVIFSSDTQLWKNALFELFGVFSLSDACDSVLESVIVLKIVCSPLDVACSVFCFLQGNKGGRGIFFL